MSSKDFQSEIGRTPQGWRRLRNKGHLYEAPVRVDGHRSITDLSQAVHVEACPQCVLEAQ